MAADRSADTAEFPETTSTDTVAPESAPRRPVRRRRRAESGTAEAGERATPASELDQMRELAQTSLESRSRTSRSDADDETPKPAPRRRRTRKDAIPAESAPAALAPPEAAVPEARPRQNRDVDVRVPQRLTYQDEPNNDSGSRRTAELSRTAEIENRHETPPAAEPARPQRPYRQPRESRPATADDDFGTGLEVEAHLPPAYTPGPRPTGPRPSSGENESEGDGTGPRRRRRRRRRGGQENTGAAPRSGPPPQHQQNKQRSNNNRYGNQNNRRSSGPSQGQGPGPGQQNYTGPEVIGTVEGVLELHPKGYGFLRDPKNDYASKETDPFVSSTMIEKHGLREGVLVRGEMGSGAKNQGPRLKSIETIEGKAAEDYQATRNFDELTPINPHEQIKLEKGAEPVTMRVVDLLCPIGKGQRALIVAPPRSGKTILLQEMADSVSHNHPEVHLIVLLIDERPEEVTEMRRRVKGEVIASSLDRELESHIRVSQLAIERAKRLAEGGKDVFILLDSITRLARAFNKWSNTGRTGTGGLDIRALDIPKKLFGTARRFEEGGSLTVVGTALVETGGRMDDAIFQEFKGTGNMELVLSRELADRRIWPAIDIAQSGTRREEKILDSETYDAVTQLRRALISLPPVQAMDDLTKKLRQFPTNREFLHRVRQVL